MAVARMEQVGRERRQSSGKRHRRGEPNPAFSYAPRQVSRRPILTINGYRLKRYELRFAAARGHHISDPALIAVVERHLVRRTAPAEHGVGFVIVHYAADGTYLLISRWYGGNMLKHDLFRLSHARGAWRATSLRPTRIVACVWELEIMAFERQAWVDAAMAHGGTDEALRLYLGAGFDGWV